MSSKIEWTDETWNPIRGCSLESEGCRNCYAMRFAHRFSGSRKPFAGLTELGPNGPRWTGEVRTIPEQLDRPLRWERARRVFVCSMSDLFHPDVPFGFIAAIFGVMGASPTHSFQLLTKRPGRAREFFAWMELQAAENLARSAGQPEILAAYLAAIELLGIGIKPAASWPLPNVELGVSVEDQDAVDRISTLAEIPTVRRFLSIEPLLGELDFHEDLDIGDPTANAGYSLLECVDWIIVGGESGPGARPVHPDWIRSIRDEAVELGIPLFFKQWGEWAPDPLADGPRVSICRRGWSGVPTFAARLDHLREHGTRCPTMTMTRVGKKNAGRELDGRIWDQEPNRRGNR